MQIDPDTLAEIQKYRVCADPIISSGHAAGAASLKDAIYRERAALVEETSAGERVPVAAWGELAALCSSASLTHAAFTNSRFVQLFQLALRETISGMTDDSTDVDAILQSNVSSLPSTDQTPERARALREAIKGDRDRWFANAVDELDIDIDIDGVPTAFWLRGATDTTASEQLTIWYAAGSVPDHLVRTLPAIPGQPSTSETGTPNNATDHTTPARDPDQAGLDMF